MTQINVDLGDRRYPILIGDGLLSQADVWREILQKYSRVVVVSNEVVAPLYLDSLRMCFDALSVKVTPVVLPDGEAFKTLGSLEIIWHALLDQRVDRQTPILALGGGVMGDLAGFAAATYQRGVPFIQVPTTLLAQVDSSVGGKTAINHALGKNMIGAFYQPRVVVADTLTLNTLPDRELRAGLAEVIKYGLIRDREFLNWLHCNMTLLLARDPDALHYAVSMSCQHKADVVMADEHEAGDRALLNLGHTFGHAIETGMGYGAWLHGEAIAAGMVMAAETSRRLGWLDQAEVDFIEALLRLAELPIRGPRLGASQYLDLMSRDKKVAQGRIRFVLLRQLGQAVTHAVDDVALLTDVIEDCCV